MAHYALINEENIVVDVIVGKDESDTTHNWEEFYSQETGYTVKQTSYNTIGGVHVLGGKPLRKNYATIGGHYDPISDAFYAPRPFDSWLLNGITCLWEAPKPKPTDGKPYKWSEDELDWVLPDDYVEE